MGIPVADSGRSCSGMLSVQGGSIATNIAEALNYAYRRGVTHRDITPADILLQYGKPVSSDLEIALAVGVAGGGRLTGTDLMHGTCARLSSARVRQDRLERPRTLERGDGEITAPFTSNRPLHDLTRRKDVRVEPE